MVALDKDEAGLVSFLVCFSASSVYVHDNNCFYDYRVQTRSGNSNRVYPGLVISTLSLVVTPVDLTSRRINLKSKSW